MAQQDELEDPAWLKELLPRRIVYATSGMEQVKVQKNLIYKQVAEKELKADVYTPINPGNNMCHPAVIFIHGGYLPPNLLTQPKDWGVYISYGQLLAASGFVGVTFNHRYYGWDYLDEAQSDVNDLITFIRDNAEMLSIDKEKICLWAFSGGGPFLSQAMCDTPAYIRCLVSYYAILDLQHLRQDIPTTVTDETLRKFSPVYQIGSKRKGIAPIFIARAGLDNPGLNEAVDRFLQTALTNNMTIDFSNHAEGHHAFDILDDNERTREIIRRTIDFIAANESSNYPLQAA